MFARLRPLFVSSVGVVALAFPTIVQSDRATDDAVASFYGSSSGPKVSFWLTVTFARHVPPNVRCGNPHVEWDPCGCGRQHAAAARKEMQAFVAAHPGKIAVVTSGGTVVPLEKVGVRRSPSTCVVAALLTLDCRRCREQNTVRFIDNFSTGTRGAKCTEYACWIGQELAL